MIHSTSFSGATHASDKLAWWCEARFGMFIHWGIYSALEGFWKGKETQGIPEWIQCRERIPLAEYRAFAADLTLENFDARAIVALARSTGMRYLVMTAKHHDGFAMFDSKVSDYNIVKMGPSRRDPCRELAEAARNAGLIMCFYYSQALDWEDPDGVGNDWDFDPSKKDFRRFLDGKCKGQLRELLTHYGPLGLIWCDVPIGISHEQSHEIKRFIQSIQPDCLVSGRISHEPGIGDYGSLGDNQLPAGGVIGDWETPGTLNNSWGYKRCDDHWKSSRELILLLCQLASKGVNYLLNIGPRADGSVPQESVQLLGEIGAWMKNNGEAIYGTSGSPMPTDFSWGRITAKNEFLYLFVMEGRSSVEFAGVRNRVCSVRLLGQPSTALAFHAHHDVLLDQHTINIEVPEGSSDSPVRVIRMMLAGAPDVIPIPVTQPDGLLELPAYRAKLQDVEAAASPEADCFAEVAQAAEAANLYGGKGLVIDPSGVVTNWFDPRHAISWRCMVYEPGTYHVELRTLAKKYGPWIGGHRVRVECPEVVTGELKADTHPETPNARYFFETGSLLGMIHIRHSGIQLITVRAELINPLDPAGLVVSGLILLRSSPTK